MLSLPVCLCPSQPSLDRPPLLHSWRAHVSTVVSIEMFIYSEQNFLISASADRTARLWTCDGCYVGQFGQEQKWNLCDPATYQHSRYCLTLMLCQ